MAINSSATPPSSVDISTQSERDKFEAEMLGFATDAVTEADTYLRATEGYSKIVPTMQAIMGVINPTIQSVRPSYASNTADNEIGRLANIIRAELTDTKPSAEFKTNNDDYEPHAVNLGKMWTSWYYNNTIDQKYGGVIDYALAAGTGYAHQLWNKFTQDVDVVAYDARDVLPVRPIDNSIQSCYSVILRREMTVNSVRAMFGAKARNIQADREGSAVKLPEVTRGSLLNSAIGASPFDRAQLTSQPAEKRGAGIPVVDLYYMYINDQSINTSSVVKMVGDFRRDNTPANDYSYYVQPGEQLYPRKRLVIFTRKMILYDGPNFYWHGMFPVSKYTLDPWQWTWLGKTPLWDCLPLQETLNRCLRIIDDHVRKILRPPVHGTKTAVSQTEIKAISESLAGPGAFWRQTTGDGVTVETVPPLDAIIKDLIEFCVSKMAQQCGVDQLQSLLQLGQMPEGPTIEKLQFATRPEIRSRSRMLEVFYREQGKMFMYNAAQFYTTRRKFAMLGKSGLTIDDYDFDPKVFFGNNTGDPHLRYNAAAEMLRGISFYVAPASLLRAAQTTDQMMAMMLFTKGAIDVQSLLERLDWPNVQQVLSRLADQMQMQMQMAQAGGPAGGSPSPMTNPIRHPLGGAPQGRPADMNHSPSMKPDGSGVSTS